MKKEEKEREKKKRLTFFGWNLPCIKTEEHH